MGKVSGHVGRVGCSSSLLENTVPDTSNEAAGSSGRQLCCVGLRVEIEIPSYLHTYLQLSLCRRFCLIFLVSAEYRAGFLGTSVVTKTII